jgi:hypothetical protein
MVVDIELEVVPLNDCSERCKLFLSSISEREDDGEIHVLEVEPSRVDRPLESGTDDLVEDFERLRQPHVCFNPQRRASVSRGR